MLLILFCLTILSISAQITPEAFITGHWINMTLLNCTSAPAPNWTITTIYIGLENSDESINSDGSDTLTAYFLANSSDSTDDAPYPANYTQTSTDPLTWQSFQETRATFIVDSTTNQSPLFVEYYVNQDQTCYYSYTKNLHQISGTWYLDWQNGNYYDQTETVTSITIAPIDNMYMIIEANSTSQNRTGYFYRSGQLLDQDLYEGLGKWRYYPDTDIFYNANPYSSLAYTKNGSYLSPEPYLGTWVNPQFDENYERNDCCVPYTIEVINSTGYPNQLLTQFYFNETALARGDCQNFVIYEVDDYVPLNVTNEYLNFTGLTYSSMENNELGSYTLNIFNTNVPSSQLVMNVAGNWGSCGFTMTLSSNGPNPNPKFSSILSINLIASAFLFLIGFLAIGIF